MRITKEFKEFFSQLDIDWAICGGDAIDLFIGEQTREHKDLDIAVFWQDREQIIKYMLDKNWRVFEPEAGKLREITDISNDYRREDNLWCISRDNNTYNIVSLGNDYYDITTSQKNQERLDFIEFLFNKQEDGHFLYKRNHALRIQMDKAIIRTQDGIPYLAPEMVLLYKSIFIRYLESEKIEDKEMVANYRHDFEMSNNRFSGEQIRWLYNALKICYPNGHEWLDILCEVMKPKERLE